MKEPETAERSDIELTPEEKQHILDKHISIEMKDGALLVSVVDCCGNADPCGCPVPKRVGFFYCRKPPCP